jgi:hypothetical protein
MSLFFNHFGLLRAVSEDLLTLTIRSLKASEEALNELSRSWLLCKHIVHFSNAKILMKQPILLIE